MRRACFISAVALLTSAVPALAGFNVCNNTPLTTRVALGQFDGRHWTSEGWWIIKPKTCAGLIAEPLNARYYYLYAADSAAGIWEGKTHFCVAPDVKFKSPARDNCAKRGLDRRGFFQVDTGKSPNWTQSLSN